MQTVRVVIADDEPTLRGALCDLIGRETDLSVVGTAGDADEAVRVAREFQPDIALVDVKMPGGGPRTAREIRATCELTRVLALSAHEDRATVLDMMQAGALGYVVKGSPPRELVEAIRRAARGQASLSAGVLTALVDELAVELRGGAAAGGATNRSEERFLRDDLQSQPDEETRLILYRIVQESLTNARKHASAESVRMQLDESEGGYLVTVSDDGSGFDPGIGARPGLAAMRERAELAGGWLHVDSLPGSGTTVEFWIPRSVWRRDETLERIGSDPGEALPLS